jgi:serine/threonine-protein kinase
MGAEPPTEDDLEGLALPEAERIDQVCDRFETAWRAGEWPCIEGFVNSIDGPDRSILLRNLIALEVELRFERGERPDAAEYRLRFPGEAAVDEVFRPTPRPGALRSTFSFAGNTLSAGPSIEPTAPAGSTLSMDLIGPGAAPPGTADRAVGLVVGDYQIIGRVGSGGMGVVYKALQKSVGRVVALKLIKAEWMGETTEVTIREAEAPFRNEARALGQLVHDHIVPVYDVGHEAGTLYFSMRLVNGKTLSHAVRDNGAFAPHVAARYIAPIARAIQHAHDAGLLHRDIKPGNIILDDDDRPWLVDFGLAKYLDATDFGTLTGQPLGTPEYMSPEQARGDRDVSFATDVYGLGSTLFALLTGQPPFSGTNRLAVLRKAIDDEPAWPRHRDKAVGREMKAICLKCLEKDPARRFSSAGALAQALEKYLNLEASGVVPPSPWEKLSKWVRRKPWRAAALAASLLVVIVLGGSAAGNAMRDRGLAELFVRDLQTIPITEVPQRIADIAPQRRWVAPLLAALERDYPADAELRARVALALLRDEPGRARELTARLLECGPDEHRVIRDALRPHVASVAPVFDEVLSRSEPDSRPGRRTRAAAALIALDRGDVASEIAAPAWAELRFDENPDRRVALLDWLVRSKVDPAQLLGRLDHVDVPSERRMILQALGSMGEGSPPAVLSSSVARLEALYRGDPDPGVHSSLAYLFRRWGKGNKVAQLDDELAKTPRGDRRWYVNSVGQTLAVIGCDGSGALGYKLAVATTETTLGQFALFDPGHAARRRKLRVRDLTDDHPAEVISYVTAARFCNWLSKKEQIPEDQWCYVVDDTEKKVTLAPDYLTRRGYRLPNLQEWEFAARAGTTTDRYFGGSDAVLRDYAWSRENTDTHPEPVARLRPNDFGLFDILGNVTEWCYNPDPPHAPRCTCTATRGADCTLSRDFVSIRGGCFSTPRTANALVAKPSLIQLDERDSREALNNNGFRLVRLEP